jgi:hypothetical protein
MESMARVVVMLSMLLYSMSIDAMAYDWDGDLPVMWDTYDDYYNGLHNNVSVGSWSDLFKNATAPASSSSDVVETAFRIDERDLFQQLGSLLSGLLFGNVTATGVQLSNATSKDPRWALISVVALMPLRCASVDQAVATFNAAIQAANPEASVSSVARRLGARACTPGGICPCQRDVRARALEIKSTASGGPLVLPDIHLLPFPLVRWRQLVEGSSEAVPTLF